MPKPNFPHDALFKTAMSDIRIAREFFARFLPDEIKANINLDDLILCQQNYANKSLKQSYLDILYKAKKKYRQRCLFTLRTSIYFRLSNAFAFIKI